MAKHQYMITENYVGSWKILDALRELVSNGVDAEVQHNAPLNVNYNARKRLLVIRNSRTQLDVKALYLGGTEKTGNEHLIGQYGEGLKLALLVLARNGIPVKIHNGNEDWKATIEPDANGIKVLTIHTKKASVDSGCVEVEIGDVTQEMWDEVEGMFLRLLPAELPVATQRGSILFDTERVGKYYVKGVFVARVTNSSFSYDFKSLNVGRDRASFDAYEAEVAITHMWEEAATHSAELVAKLFTALRSEARDVSAFAWMTATQAQAPMVAHFRELYGSNAYPTTSTTECPQIEHLGYRPIVLPQALVTFLRRGLPSLVTISRERAESVGDRFALAELTPEEQTNLLECVELLKSCDPAADATGRVAVVTFGEPTLLGLHRGTEIQIARRVVADYGELLATLIHEVAHDMGGDGTVPHMARVEALSAKVFNRLRGASRTP